MHREKKGGTQIDSDYPLDILKTLAKDLASTKPLNIPAKYTVDAYHYVLEDLNRLKMTKKRMAKYIIIIINI